LATVVQAVFTQQEVQSVAIHHVDHLLQQAAAAVALAMVVKMQDQPVVQVVVVLKAVQAVRHHHQDKEMQVEQVTILHLITQAAAVVVQDQLDKPVHQHKQVTVEREQVFTLHGVWQHQQDKMSAVRFSMPAAAVQAVDLRKPQAAMAAAVMVV
jgi:hypothetical protein